MAKKNKNNEPMLEETSSGPMLEENSNSAILEESVDNALLEEKSQVDSLLEENIKKGELLEESSMSNILLDEESESDEPKSESQCTVKMSSKKPTTKRKRMVSSSPKISSRGPENFVKHDDYDNGEDNYTRNSMFTLRSIWSNIELIWVFVSVFFTIFKRPILISLGLIVIYFLVHNGMPFKSCGNNNENDTSVSDVIADDASININPELDVKTQLSAYYDYVYSLQDGFYKLKKDDKYGLATKSGVVVAKPKYDHIFPKNKNTGLIKVKTGEKFGFLNAEGREVLAPKYDYIYAVATKSGLLEVEINDKHGFINLETMKEVTPCVYTRIYSLEGWLYKVEIGDKIGYLNKSGTVFKTPE